VWCIQKFGPRNKCASFSHDKKTGMASRRVIRDRVSELVSDDRERKLLERALGDLKFAWQRTPRCCTYGTLAVVSLVMTIVCIIMTVLCESTHCTKPCPESNACRFNHSSGIWCLRESCDSVDIAALKTEPDCDADAATFANFGKGEGVLYGLRITLLIGSIIAGIVAMSLAVLFCGDCVMVVTRAQMDNRAVAGIAMAEKAEKSRLVRATLPVATVVHGDVAATHAIQALQQVVHPQQHTEAASPPGSDADDDDILGLDDDGVV
jgi:hypothetical protein